MCDLIKLAQMPKGNPYKKLSLYEKDYIIENFMYQPFNLMADILQIKYQDIEIFCRTNGYMPPKKLLNKPTKKTKDLIFDIDTYLTFTI
jgi:hypothetical protein